MSLSEPGPTPSTDIELVERLRAKVFAGPAEDQRLKLVAEEAAARISTLSSENAVLREALVDITDCGAEAWGEDRPCVELARAALSDGGRDGE